MFVAIYHNFKNNNLDIRFIVSKNYSQTEVFYILFGNKKLCILVNGHKGAIKYNRKTNKSNFTIYIYSITKVLKQAYTNIKIEKN